MKDQSRRDILQQGSLLAALLGCGLLTTGQAIAASETKLLETKTLDEVYKALGAKPTESKDVTITSPDIAENGAVVPIAVTSKIPNTEEIHILIAKNPSPYAASFTIPEGTDPFVSTRAKMGQSSDVIALVKADGKFYSTTKETKVTLGGCGG